MTRRGLYEELLEYAQTHFDALWAARINCEANLRRAKREAEHWIAQAKRDGEQSIGKAQTAFREADQRATVAKRLLNFVKARAEKSREQKEKRGLRVK